ncbi:dethiobiotin synthase [Halomonas pacifica]|uniref:ATP-dependent dethiobiotin synthetase BioD n=1 Tax=Bisbaumannia pacifica TaxID=77098 RepID=A0A510X7S8_9GAMM|nr:dethiobiotin synthase [Halomonas pacifica]MBH8578532.1 dethiobiotin synthase [Halomonas pacifica]MDC8803876.1 dethiobiotin synthase [Halomonas pacifica]GEK47444.1 ATP-dependent dethiobiotin synthetase BioD [Halomonas pacifica]
MRAYFVTGTDTDAGKTLVAAGLLARAQAAGLTTLGLKPVASGCETTPQGLRNADALALQAVSAPAMDYAAINPHAYAPAIAPHLAAERAGDHLTLAGLVECLAPQLALPRDLILVEGAGGWRVPLNDREDLAGLASRLALPVILVVGLKLGAINYARLSAEAIRADGLTLAGWVANGIDAEMQEQAANLACLRRHLPEPCLGVVPPLGDGSPQALASAAAAHLRLPGEANNALT